MHINMGLETDIVLQISRFFYDDFTLITLRDTKMSQNFTELPYELQNGLFSSIMSTKE
jgi:hypothetical protein